MRRRPCVSMVVPRTYDYKERSICSDLLPASTLEANGVACTSPNLSTCLKFSALTGMYKSDVVLILTPKLTLPDKQVLCGAVTRIQALNPVLAVILKPRITKLFTMITKLPSRTVFCPL
jgi:hypothetical protein